MGMTCRSKGVNNVRIIQKEKPTERQSDSDLLRTGNKQGVVDTRPGKQAKKVLANAYAALGGKVRKPIKRNKRK